MDILKFVFTWVFILLYGLLYPQHEGENKIYFIDKAAVDPGGYMVKHNTSNGLKNYYLEIDKIKGGAINSIDEGSLSWQLYKRRKEFEFINVYSINAHFYTAENEGEAEMKYPKFLKEGKVIDGKDAIIRIPITLIGKNKHFFRIKMYNKKSNIRVFGDWLCKKRVISAKRCMKRRCMKRGRYYFQLQYDISGIHFTENIKIKIE